MLYKNTRLQGAAGVAAAIDYFARRGCPVFIPLSEGQRYDLVVEENSRLLRIECKAALTKARKVYQVELRTSGGNRSGTGKQSLLSTDEMDVLIVLDGDGCLWRFEASEVADRRALNLTEGRRHTNLVWY